MRVEPIRLFLDIDGVLSVSDPDTPRQRLGCFGPLASPVAGAKPLLQAIDQAHWIEPFWMSTWGDEAIAWNVWAQTRRWAIGYPLRDTQQGQAQAQFPTLPSQSKCLAVRWHCQDWPHRMVWIEDGFWREAKQWANQQEKIQLIDTVPPNQGARQGWQRGLRAWNLETICTALALDIAINTAS